DTRRVGGMTGVTDSDSIIEDLPARPTQNEERVSAETLIDTLKRITWGRSSGTSAVADFRHKKAHLEPEGMGLGGSGKDSKGAEYGSARAAHGSPRGLIRLSLNRGRTSRNLHK